MGTAEVNNGATGEAYWVLGGGEGQSGKLGGGIAVAGASGLMVPWQSCPAPELIFCL